MANPKTHPRRPEEPLTFNAKAGDRVQYKKHPTHVGVVIAPTNIVGLVEVLWDHAGKAGVPSGSSFVSPNKLEFHT